MSEDAAAWPRPGHGTGEEEGHPPCLTLDHSGQRALVRGRAVPLTRTEALVLRVLLEARGRTVAVGDILVLAGMVKGAAAAKSESSSRVCVSALATRG